MLKDFLFILKVATSPYLLAAYIVFLLFLLFLLHIQNPPNDTIYPKKPLKSKPKNIESEHLEEQEEHTQENETL